MHYFQEQLVLLLLSREVDNTRWGEFPQHEEKASSLTRNQAPCLVRADAGGIRSYIPTQEQSLKINSRRTPPNSLATLAQLRKRCTEAPHVILWSERGTVYAGS